MGLKGYARVSTADQDTALQVAALRRAGVRQITTETGSGAARRPELEALLRRLRPGDVLMVYKIDRLARSLVDLMRVLQLVADAGASFKSLTEPIETTTPAGRLLLQMLGAVAEFERAIIMERTAAGRVAAMERGVIFGRRPVLDEHQARDLVARYECATHAARAAGVSLGAMKRAAARYGLRFRYEGRTDGARWAAQRDRLARAGMVDMDGT